MRNIHLLPTEKPSRIFEFGNLYHLQKYTQENFRSFTLYIISTEKIKEDDWIIDLDTDDVYKFDKRGGLPRCRKIILTTDQDLISDGIEQISENALLKIVEYINSGKNIESFDEL